MIKLVAFDVDGTLLSHKTFSVPESAVKAIRELQAKGIKVAIASGRPWFEMRNVHDAGIFADYYIGCNGAAVVEHVGDEWKFISMKSFTMEETEAIVEMCREHDFPLSFKCQNKNVVYFRYEYFQEIYERLMLNPKNFMLDDTQSFHKTELPLNAVTFMDQESAKKLSKEYPSMVLLPFSPTGYDVSVVGIDKGWGLEQLLQYLNLSKEECMAFGDGTNDAEMLRLAGIGVAMKECSQEALEAADYQTDDILEDGVLKALQHFEIL